MIFEAFNNFVPSLQIIEKADAVLLVAPGYVLKISPKK